jgi:excisionase family DNA binding protein
MIVISNLLTESQVAETLRVSVATIRRWRCLGQGPRFFKVGTLVRYSLEDVHTWLASRPTGGEHRREMAGE